MHFQDFRDTYVLSDGQVLNLSIDFQKPSIRALLNVLKRIGSKYHRHEIEILFEEVFELDVLESFDAGWHTDVVFTRLESRTYYVSFDPFGNAGLPSDQDNFVMKCRKVSVRDGGDSFDLD